MGMTGPIVVDLVAAVRRLMDLATVVRADPARTEVVRVAMRAVPQVVGSGAATAPVERVEAQVDVLLRNGWSNMRCVSTPMATASSTAPNC
jgi:hypothetical protein